MSVRAALVLLHRYAGLVLAGFLLLAGLTGSLLAWNHELEAALQPQLFKVAAPRPDALMLDALELRERVRAQYPHARIRHVRLALAPGESVFFFLQPAPGGAELPNNQVFIDPYTGRLLGERQWGDITQGMKNLMPFIYRLHYSLALGAPGELVFGIVALLWTLDCFVGAWLTLPARATQNRKRWLARWWPAWRVRWKSSPHKRNVDLHRAGGLWPWAMLFVLAWSGVAFNLQEVYRPVMRSLFEHQRGQLDLPRLPAPNWQPRLDWNAARDRGRKLAAQAARDHDFVIEREFWLSFDPDRGLYRFDVRSDRDIRDPGGDTSVFFDANTGALLAVWAPTGSASGDTIRTWITSLHMAALWGWPMKLFVCLMGVVVVVLSATGVVIWVRKRNARRAMQRQAARLTAGIG